MKLRDVSEILEMPQFGQVEGNVRVVGRIVGRLSHNDRVLAGCEDACRRAAERSLQVRQGRRIVVIW